MTEITIIFILFLYLTGSIGTKNRPLNIVVLPPSHTHGYSFIFIINFSSLIPKNQNLYAFTSTYALYTLKFFSISRIIIYLKIVKCHSIGNNVSLKMQATNFIDFIFYFIFKFLFHMLNLESHTCQLYT